MRFFAGMTFADSYLWRLRQKVGSDLVLMPGAMVVLQRPDGHVLLTKRGDTGEWCLPAGAAEVGGSFARTAIDELTEEAGVKVSRTASRCASWCATGRATRHRIKKNRPKSASLRPMSYPRRCTNRPSMPWRCSGPTSKAAPSKLDSPSQQPRDHYASVFGIAFSTYMERPWLARLISRIVFGADTRLYYDSMSAIAEVPEDGAIVDCPCGAGPAFRALHPNTAVRYVAVDLSPSMIRRARRRANARRLENVELIEANATDIPEPTDSADLFLSYWGLHCFDEPAAALAEAARVLKPGGRLVGTCFVRGHDSIRQRLLIRPHVGDFGPIGTQADVESWLELAGFESPTIRRSGPMLLFDVAR